MSTCTGWAAAQQKICKVPHIHPAQTSEPPTLLTGSVFEALRPTESGRPHCAQAQQEGRGRCSEALQHLQCTGLPLTWWGTILVP